MDPAASLYRHGICLTSWVVWVSSSLIKVGIRSSVGDSAGGFSPSPSSASSLSLDRLDSLDLSAVGKIGRDMDMAFDECRSVGDGFECGRNLTDALCILSIRYKSFI